MYGLFSATVSALKHSLTGTHSIQLTYTTTQHRDDVPSQPDLGHGRSGSTEHRRPDCPVWKEKQKKKKEEDAKAGGAKP